MAEQSTQSDRVGALANRLRLIEKDYADQAEEVRRGYIAEEVRRVRAIVPQEQWGAFLAELKQQCPQLNAQDIDANPNDAGALIAKLIELFKALPEPQRQGITEQLKAAGVVAAATIEWPREQLADLRSKLQLSPNDRIEPGRGLELVAQLTDFVTNLDKVAWGTWRAMHPNTAHRRSTPLQTTLCKFAIGDPAVGREQLTHDLKALRQLTGALIAALSQTGRIAIEHFRSLAPEEIKLLVGTKGFNREAAYWRKYEELAGAMDVQTIEQAIRDGLVAYADPMVTRSAG